MSRARWLVALLALAVALAACGDSADTLSGEPVEAPSDAAPGAPAGEADAAEPPAARELGAGGIAAALQTITDIGREIIFTAELTVGVGNVAAAGEEATRIVQDAGGFLFGQQTTGAPEPSSVLVFKVRPADFQAVLADLGAIGELRTQNVSAEDVTERVVDLESRIDTAAASVERLKQFLGDANDIVTITELEEQLLQRETDLETLRGQLRTIRDRVDLATITLTLTEALADPQLALQVTAYRGHEDGGLSCPGDGGLVVDRDDEVTVCFEITNTGDTPLTGFTLTDNVLGVGLDDLVVVFGDPTGTLQPGQAIELAAEVTVPRSTRTQTRVTAQPVDAEGNPIESRDLAATDSIALDAVDPGGLPGFADGFSAAWKLLKWLGGVAILFAGFAVPFLWVPVIALVLVLWLRRRERSAPEPAPPPPAEPEPEDEDEEAAAAAPEEGDQELAEA